jgi:hypothetical protein
MLNFLFPLLPKKNLKICVCRFDIPKKGKNDDNIVTAMGSCAERAIAENGNSIGIKETARKKFKRPERTQNGSYVIYTICAFAEMRKFCGKYAVNGKSF